MRPSEAWREWAACRGLVQPGGADPFFPEQGESPRAGKRVCVGCPVRMPCLIAGMEERHGTWGGFTRNERASLRRDAKKAQAA